MEIVFWLSVVFVGYVYAGYPALLAVWSRLAPKPFRERPQTPPVTIVIAARNEARQLAARVANLRALDYPQADVQIILVLDGSDDGTDATLERLGDQIDVVRLPPGGKARALNAGVAAARHDILVFADARQPFASDALRALVAPLADPAVGGVCGELVIDSESGDGGDSAIGEGIGGYWRYEKWLRRHESLIGSTLGATGAIYALRRDLWRPLPDDTILDDVLAPMRAVLNSSRIVFAAGARAFDHAAPAATELSRKIRTLAGNYQILRCEPRLLNPRANPVWLQYMSHKVGRLFVPYALVALVVSSAALAPASPVYAVAFACQVVFYALAAYGAYLVWRDRRQAGSTSVAAADPRVVMKGSNT
jgi:hypothetical protein